ncbi:hypothetical protein LXA43DRAFT_981979 [Ganoderma leucocontextum]|nr:hypothetical protein LXA43DRAFT_981979 [Ganoderma leucocontextum]
MVIVIDLTGEDCESDSSHASEISCTGFKRNIDMSKSHLDTLEADGLVYAGFNASPVPAKREVILILDSDDEEPLLKKKKPRSESRSSGATRSCVKNEASRCRNRGPPPKSQAEIQREIEREEEDYVAALSALNLNYQPNWTNCSYPQRLHLDVDDREHVQNELAASLAAKATYQMISERVYRRISKLPKDHFDWRPPRNREHRPLYLFEGMPPSQSKVSNSPEACTSRNTASLTHARLTPGRPSPGRLVPRATIHQAPGDTNTIVQTRDIIAVASAVLDGDLDDTPGPYNKEGSLFASFQSHG